MTIRERVFERWLASGDGLTFEEWRAARQARAKELRLQEEAAKRLTGNVASGHTVVMPHVGWQQIAIRQEFYPKYWASNSLGGLSGLVSGIFGGRR